MDILILAEALFSNTWMILTGINFPSTEIPIAAIMIGVLIIFVSVAILKKILSGGGK